MNVWRETGRRLGVIGIDAVHRPRPRPGTIAGAARRCPRRRGAILLRDRRRHRRPRLCLQAADRPLLGATRPRPPWKRSAPTSRSRHPHVPILLDAKRGDIGSTAEFYAREVFGRYGADAATYNPYLGTDAAEPLLARGAVFAICRTSNAGSRELQDLDVAGRPLYERVAELVATRWAQLGECGLVVGATYPQQLASVREIAGDLPILVPAVGEQGGDVAASVIAGTTAGRHRAAAQLLARHPLRPVRRGLRRSGAGARTGDGGGDQRRLEVTTPRR